MKTRTNKRIWTMILSALLLACCGTYADEEAGFPPSHFTESEADERDPWYIPTPDYTPWDDYVSEPAFEVSLKVWCAWGQARIVYSIGDGPWKYYAYPIMVSFPSGKTEVTVYSYTEVNGIRGKVTFKTYKLKQ